MKLQLQITTRNMSLSKTAEEKIRQKAEKLNKIYERITSCRILVEAPHRHQQQGVLYNVTINIAVPGREVIVKREPNKDLYVAIRDAFDAARRQLQNHSSRQRGDVKTHEPAMSNEMGQIARLFADDGYGFIRTKDGRDVYFHHNSVRNDDFENLNAGSAVQFVEVDGEQGPQASTVMLVD